MKPPILIPAAVRYPERFESEPYRVTVQLVGEDAERLRVVAERHAVSLTEAVRMLVRDRLAEREAA